MLPVSTIRGTTLQIRYQDLTKIKLIKKSTMANIHIGKWVHTGDRPVAIKKFRMKTCPSYLEGEFSPYLSVNGHLNILSLLGVCLDPGKFAMVLEWGGAPLGTLLDSITELESFEFAEQIATGLAYLHTYKIAHMHLKYDNVFVKNYGTSNVEVKLADFGLSKLKLETASNATSRAETIVRFRAPETFTREYARAKSNFDLQAPADIYSFGALLWGMNTRKEPFAGKTESAVVQLKTAGTHETLPKNLRLATAYLIQKCWALPKQRPTAFDLKKELLAIKARVILDDLYFKMRVFEAAFLVENCVFLQPAMGDVFPTILGKITEVLSDQTISLTTGRALSVLSNVGTEQQEFFLRKLKVLQGTVAKMTESHKIALESQRKQEIERGRLSIKEALSPEPNKSLPLVSETVITVLPKKPLSSDQKLFIRGSGAGLNWEHGVELIAVGDGTFCFKTDVPFTGKLEYQFLMNDQICEERPKRQIGQGKTKECIF